MYKQVVIFVALFAAVVESIPAPKELSERLPKFVPDEQKVNTLGIQDRGTPTLAAYPTISEFIAFATNCAWSFDSANTLYTVTSVTDAIVCATEFCYPDKRCTHFTFDSAGTGTCTILNSYGVGPTTSITYTNTKNCGLIPARACEVNKGSSGSLLGCLSITSV